MSKPKSFLQWALAHATPEQKNLFLEEFATEISQMHAAGYGGQDRAFTFVPDNANKMALYEAFQEALNA